MGLIQIRNLPLAPDVFVCCMEDYCEAALSVVGEELCLLLPIVETTKVKRDMCDFTPQLTRHTSTVSGRASAVCVSDQFRHCRI